LSRLEKGGIIRVKVGWGGLKRAVGGVKRRFVAVHPLAVAVETP